tara:strand:- start:507 stop:644 length:138 start_codon:yes stop_codon:yes gene_type:complete
MLEVGDVVGVVVVVGAAGVDELPPQDIDSETTTNRTMARGLLLIT